MPEARGNPQPAAVVLDQATVYSGEESSDTCCNQTQTDLFFQQKTILIFKLTRASHCLSNILFDIL